MHLYMVQNKIMLYQIVYCLASEIDFSKNKYI